MRRAHQLVIACNLAHHLRRQTSRPSPAASASSRRNLLLTGYVTDRQLAALYRSCELFVFPSLYEGAGLPILEAMSCGAPVAVSGVSAMPELLGDTDATFDPSDPEDMARCIREVLTARGPRRLRERSRRRPRSTRGRGWPGRRSMATRGPGVRSGARRCDQLPFAG